MARGSPRWRRVGQEGTCNPVRLAAHVLTPLILVPGPRAGQEVLQRGDLIRSSSDDDVLGRRTSPTVDESGHDDVLRGRGSPALDEPGRDLDQGAPRVRSLWRRFPPPIGQGREDLGQLEP